MRKSENYRQLIDAALQFYTRLEKRGLPLEASKALINCLHGDVSRDVAGSMLRKTKEFVDFWIEDTSLAQVYKRFVNHLLKKKDISLDECMVPFVLVGCWETFTGYSFERLKAFFEGLNLEECMDLNTREERLRCIYRKVAMRGRGRLAVTSHVAYLTDPYTFTPLTPSMVRTLGLVDLEGYMRFNGYVRSKGFRPLEVYALLHLLLEETPSKTRVLEDILGIDREMELLLEAQRLWNRGRFYEAHEVLEDLWTIQRDNEVKEALQGIIRIAIALHHYVSGRRGKALKVLKAALPQVSRPVNMRLNREDLANWTESAVKSLRSGDGLQDFPTLRVL